MHKKTLLSQTFASMTLNGQRQYNFGNLKMAGWRKICLHFVCLAGVLVCAFGTTAAESGFRQYRENVLKEIEEIKASLEKGSPDAKKHFQLGLAYMALGRHRDEVAEYLEAVRLEPDFADAHYNLGLAYDLLEDGGLAIRHMRNAQAIYSADRNHRGVRASQRYIRTFKGKYGRQPAGEAHGE
jgi:tetratricopeptide (TPR) repeat protein